MSNKVWKICWEDWKFESGILKKKQCRKPGLQSRHWIITMNIDRLTQLWTHTAPCRPEVCTQTSSQEWPKMNLCGGGRGFVLYHSEILGPPFLNVFMHNYLKQPYFVPSVKHALVPWSMHILVSCYFYYSNVHIHAIYFL